MEPGITSTTHTPTDTDMGLANEDLPFDEPSLRPETPVAATAGAPEPQAQS